MGFLHGMAIGSMQLEGDGDEVSRWHSKCFLNFPDHLDPLGLVREFFQVWTWVFQWQAFIASKMPLELREMAARQPEKTQGEIPKSSTVVAVVLNINI